MKKFIVFLIIILSVVFPFAAEAKQPAEESPLSLPALMRQEFDGSGLKRVKVLAVNDAYTRYLITYKSGKYNISGIMNVPKGKGPFPVLILNHGYIDPKYYTVGRGLKREQDYFARNGYVVVHPDYRNHGLSDKDPQSEAGFRLGYVEDVINAVMAVKRSSFSFMDRDKIGMLGHSLGGGIALNILVTKPGLVQACALYAPVSGDYYENFLRWTKRGNPELAEKIISVHGTPDTNPKFWNDLSAIKFIQNIKAQVILHHGTLDESVPFEWSERLAEKFKEKEKPITFLKYTGEKHEFIRDWTLFMQRNLKFFAAVLK